MLALKTSIVETPRKNKALITSKMEKARKRTIIKAEAIRNRPPYVSENPARWQAQQRPQFVTSLYFKD